MVTLAAASVPLRVAAVVEMPPLAVKRPVMLAVLVTARGPLDEMPCGVLSTPAELTLMLPPGVLSTRAEPALRDSMRVWLAAVSKPKNALTAAVLASSRSIPLRLPEDASPSGTEVDCTVSLRCAVLVPIETLPVV